MSDFIGHDASEMPHYDNGDPEWLEKVLAGVEAAQKAEAAGSHASAAAFPAEPHSTIYSDTGALTNDLLASTWSSASGANASTRNGGVPNVDIGDLGSPPSSLLQSDGRCTAATRGAQSTGLYTGPVITSNQAGTGNLQTMPPTQGNQRVCPYHGCPNTQIFKRNYELERHMKKHSPPEMFDCVVATCNRRGENGFYRKDKVYDHVRKAHGIGKLQ